MVRVTAFLSLAGIFLLSGCATGVGTGTRSVVAPAQRGAQGVVYGGQQPVSGATITLWAVGTGGYGSSATSLTSTTTAADGSFSITGTYSCPGSNPFVYITAVGGNPGLTAGTNNSALRLMTVLSDCNTLVANAATTFININEVTTVAAAYALGQFMSPSTGSIGSYGYQTNGLGKAFSTVKSLVNFGTGSALSTTPSGNGVVPQSELNTLADILVPCVNSASGASSACTLLFGALQPTQSIAPTDTLLAALSMAQHPGANVSNLFSLVPSTPPFQPTLSSAPNDLTVAIAYNGSAPSPRSIVVDGNGSVWTANYSTGGSASSISKLSPTGALQFHSSTNANIINGANVLAVDTQNNIWLGNKDNNTLVGFQNNGNSFAGPFTQVSGPSAMAFDAYGKLWIANQGNSSVAEFNTSTNSFITSNSGFTGGGINAPTSIAVDALGNTWVGNGTTVTELNNLGVASAISPLSAGGISSPGGVAIDGSNNVWVSNYPTGGVVAELNNSGSALSGTGYTGGGVGPASTIAVDGGGNIWIAEGTLNRLAELSSTGVALSPATGYQGGNLNSPTSLAIDRSGNVWVANLNSTTTNSITTTISEFVGAAVPTITPTAAALTSALFGVRPGTPVSPVIVSGALPYYVPGSSYSAQLYASGGNSGTYTWSISSGGLPNPLSLSAGGLISGTTSLTGTSTFVAQACDSINLTNCATKTLSLTASTTPPVLGNESALTGSYAVQVEGFKNGITTGNVVGSDFVASIHFNGTGGVTGEIDSNNPSNASAQFATLSGGYSYGSDNRGIVYLTPSSGTPLELAIAGSNFSGSTPQTLRLILFDDTVPSTGGSNLSTGSGIGKLQTSGAFNSTAIGQSWVFGLQGETPCSTCNGTVSPFGPLSVVGKFTANSSNGITSGEQDAAAVNNSYNLMGLTGSYTSPDASGRGTVTFAITGTPYPAPALNFIYYIVNTGEMYLMSLDGHATHSLLSGDAVAQTGTFSNTTLSGSYVAYETSGTNGNGSSFFPNALDSTLIYLAVQPGNQLAATIDENDGQGKVKLNQSQGSISYSIDSNGRMTLGDPSQPVLYLANGSQFFGTEQPSGTNQGGPGLITGVQQTSGTFNCSLSGNFAVGTNQFPVQATASSGEVNMPSGAVTLDVSDFSGVMQQGNGGTVTCTSDANTATTGRALLSYTVGSTQVVYTIVPNSKYLLLTTNPNDGRPVIFTVEK